MDCVFLLPPSESKRVGGTGAFVAASGRFSALSKQRAAVAAALSETAGDPGALARLTGVRSEQAARTAAAANRAVLGAPTLPAGTRYTGVVWAHLDPAGLTPPARERASGIVVVSALGGLFAFDDPVPEYKLKMGARLGSLGPLPAFWRPALTAALAEAATGRVVFDLLPGEHRKAVDLEAAAGERLVRVEFRTATGSGAAGHQAKAAKGRFVRHLLEADPPGLDAAGRFAWEGWRVGEVGPGLVVVRAPR